MKTLGTIVAAASVAIIMSFGAANAQSGSASGTGGAVQQDKPSTAGLSNPGGRPSMSRMRMGRRHMRHHRRHRRHM